MATQNYLSTIKKNLRPGSFAKIALKARGFAKFSRRGGSFAGEMVDDDDRALLVDVSDDDGESVE